MNEPKFKLGDKVLVEGEVREIIPTCSARSPLYGVILNDGVLVAQADNDLHLDIGFSNGTERREQCVEPGEDDAKTMPNATTKQMADFTHFICNKLDELKELFNRKNRQYSVGGDPLANFRAGALLCDGSDSFAAMYEEAKGYRRKHVVHVERNGIDGDKVDESLDDIIVYSAIMAYMRHCHEQEQSND